MPLTPPSPATAASRPGPGGDHQRLHAQDERNGSSGSPAAAAGMTPLRLECAACPPVCLAGRTRPIEDGVLARQSDQHTRPDLHEDVHGPVGEQQAGHRAEQAQRHHQDDRQRPTTNSRTARPGRGRRTPPPGRTHTWRCAARICMNMISSTPLAWKSAASRGTGGRFPGMASPNWRPGPGLPVMGAAVARL